VFRTNSFCSFSLAITVYLETDRATISTFITLASKVPGKVNTIEESINRALFLAGADFFFLASRLPARAGSFSDIFDRSKRDLDQNVVSQGEKVVNGILTMFRNSWLF
jgi:hypothetical protein